MCQNFLNENKTTKMETEKQIPEKIYIGEEYAKERGTFPTWREREKDSDIEYIRKDLVQKMIKESIDF